MDWSLKNKTSKKNKLIVRVGKKVGIVLLSFLCIALIAIVGSSLYFSKRWYPNTYVNGINFSNQSYDQVKNQMKEMIQNYQLKVVGRDGGVDEIDRTEIHLEVDIETPLKELYDKQHETSLLSSLFHKNEETLTYSISYDKDALKTRMDQSILITGDDSYKIQKPVDAYVSYSEKTKSAEITDAVKGNTLDKKKLEVYLQNAVESFQTSIDLTDEKAYPDVYKSPSYEADSPELIEAKNTFNNYLYHWIVWDMGEGTTESLTPDHLKNWISVNKKQQVILDEDAVSNWVEKICLKYKTVGTTRHFTTHDGQKITVSGGDYGWRIDYTKAVEDTINLLKKEPNSAVLQAYLDNPTKQGEEALTVKMDPEYTSKAYQKDYKNFETDWDPKNYSEVDISEQKVYVYKNGKLAFSCICVTGLPQNGRDTDTGCWYIKEKKDAKVLVGPGYRSPTKYWVRITWSGIGYHYMGRSDWGRWSPSLYKSRGSHGCVNLQLPNAKKIYSLVNIGDAVFIHK